MLIRTGWSQLYEPTLGDMLGRDKGYSNRTAFGNIEYMFLASFGEYGWNANYGFPETVDGATLAFREFEYVYPPVSRAAGSPMHVAPRRHAVADLEVEIGWDDGNEMAWDDDNDIGWEA